MSLHKEVSSRFKGVKAKHVSRLLDIDKSLDVLESQSDPVFRAYEGEVETMMSEVGEMQKEIAEMRGNTSGGSDEKNDEKGETDNTVKFPVDGQTKTSAA